MCIPRASPCRSRPRQVWLGCWPKWGSVRPSTRMAGAQPVITDTYVLAHKHTNVCRIGSTHLRPKEPEVRIIGLPSWLQTPRSVQGLSDSLHSVQVQSVHRCLEKDHRRFTVSAEANIYSMQSSPWIQVWEIIYYIKLHAFPPHKLNQILIASRQQLSNLTRSTVSLWKSTCIFLGEGFFTHKSSVSKSFHRELGVTVSAKITLISSENMFCFLHSTNY